MALLAAGASVRAAESLRIVPIVADAQVLVSFDVADAYTDDVREAIASGLRTTFTYDIELRMIVPMWVDRTLATAVASASDQYDNLTRRHSLSRIVDGRVEEKTVTEDEKALSSDARMRRSDCRGVACGGLEVAGGHNAPFCGFPARCGTGTCASRSVLSCPPKRPQVGQGGALAVL